ncbi:hypothetical protein CGRA01v4_12851 [Colletotrichum graminicola]|nr:hypothetical protein CGRA01v4_12851 [Colletotrichum graminicola]
MAEELSALRNVGLVSLRQTFSSDDETKGHKGRRGGRARRWSRGHSILRPDNDYLVSAGVQDIVTRGIYETYALRVVGRSLRETFSV